MKKNINKINEQYNGDSSELRRIGLIAFGVLLFFACAYFIGGVVTGNIKLKKEKKPEVSIQYSEILAEMTFKQNDDDYFVMYYDFDSNEAILLDQIQSGIQNIAKTYKVDLGKNFNKNYITEEDLKTNPKSISELKVKNPTLIRIKNGKVVNYIVGATNINNYALKLI